MRQIKNINNTVSTNSNTDQVNDLLQQMGEFLSERLEAETPHKAIWNEFVEEPEENAASLAGVLEALFEAQPAVRKRVDAFTRKITALEAQQSDHHYVKPGAEDALSTGIGEVRFFKDDSGEHIAQEDVEADHPAYLYGNERTGVESVQQEPEPKTTILGDDAQIILTPDENIPYPHIFTHLQNAIEQSDNLRIDQKHHLQEHLNEIHLQLSGENKYDEIMMANAFEKIWETDALYAHALIESLKRDIEKLPIQSQGFIIQLQIPLER